jgi:hypothetical protein
MAANGTVIDRTKGLVTIRLFAEDRVLVGQVADTGIVIATGA